MTTPGISSVDACELASMLDDGNELALLDVREEGVFARSHLLFAASLPLSRIEERIGDQVPRLRTRIVVTSDDEGLADEAFARLASLGYSNVRVMEGGNTAWQRPGYKLFGGIHVPSKAFGELVERAHGTPMIDAKVLKGLIDSGQSVAVFDSRPAHEFRRMNIPGARNCPGGDLVYRLPEVLPSRDTLVVVNCAGRTRSIIGAQSLINAGFPNKVVALKNGTMGWQLAGLSLEHGNARPLPAPGRRALETARTMAAGVRRRFCVQPISLDELETLRTGAHEQTVYLLDVRSPEEFAVGHVRGSRNAPGGQLVQATDIYMPTRNARVVLIDDDGVRASIAASWLMQMGWRHVNVYEADIGGDALEEGAGVRAWPPRPRGVDSVSALDLQAMLAAGDTMVVDVAMSHVFREEHIPNAVWAIRSRFAATLPALVRNDAVVLTSDDGRLAEFAALDATKVMGRPVKVLAGGTAAWKSAGLPLAAGFDTAQEPPDDMWHIPSSAQGGGEDAMRQYLSWEVDLIDQITGEPGVAYRVGKVEPDPQIADVTLAEATSAAPESKDAL